MKAIIEIKFFNEREIEEKSFERKTKEDDEFSPIRRHIRKKRISSNNLTLAIKTKDKEHRIAAWEYGGNFKFWMNDPNGYLMSIRFTHPDEDLMEQIAKILRRVRKFHILPGNLTLSCYVTQLGPTYREAEEILRRSCEAIKDELDPISEITISYDLSTVDDQVPQFYSKSEFLRHKPKEVDEERQPQKGPIDIERRPFDPEYAAKHGSIEPEDVLQDDYREEKDGIRRDYKEPEYPQYSKDFYKKLEKRGYYRKQKFKASHAIIIALGIAVAVGSVYGINSGLFGNLNNFVNHTNDQSTSQNTQSNNNQNSQDNTQVTANVSTTTMSGCTMTSNGLGKVRINCPNYDTISCNADPPLASGIQKDVVLTVKESQCQVQYLDPQGTTIFRSLVLVSQIIPNMNNYVQPTPQSPKTTPPTPLVQTSEAFHVSIPTGVGNDQSCVNGGNCFEPDNISIQVGTQVIWTNNDSVGHTVTSGHPSDDVTGTVFDSSLIAAGKTYSFTFQNTGTYYYFCQVHPWLTGVVIVGNGNTPPPQTNSAPPQTSAINTQQNIDDLKNYALQLINQDRAANGLSSVSLSNNQAAQIHAQDMLNVRTLSHYMTDGEKPYMVYTRLGGQGFVGQNAAFEGYGDIQQCNNLNVICDTIDPKQSISKSEYDMMHNDQASNWGHRDNILDKHHTDVSIGIAYDKYSFYMTQNFEDNYIDYRTPISESNGIVTFSGNLKAGSLSGIGIYYDPLPTSAIYDEHKNDGYYKLGDQLVTVQQPPVGTEYYPPSTSTFEVADRWIQQSNYADISFDISPFVTQAGVYTVVAYLQDGVIHFLLLRIL